MFDSEEGTAPVIGVLIMVAVCCILAAVVAVYVYGMPEDIDNTNMVGISVKQIGNQIQVTYMSSSSPDEVILINASSYNNGIYNASGEIIDPEYGDLIKFNGGTDGLDRVLVIATFDDGTTKIVYDEVI